MKTLVKYRTYLWAVLQSLGPWGVFLTAGIDGAGVPLPGAVDAVVATYVYRSPLNAWLYVLLASVGSALGCLVLYAIGYLGGEVLIERRMPAWKFQKIRHDFDEHAFLALAVPSMLPPPFPFKIVVLAAGAFEMHWTQFLVAILVGRLVRFTALSLLTIKFGPQIVTLFTNSVKHHPLISLAVVAGAVVIALLVRHLRRSEAVEISENPAR